MDLSKNGTAYELIGPQTAPVVVLIHGLGLTRNGTWGQIAPILADRYQILMYDLSGHGETALPQGEVSLTSLSEQLIVLLDELDIECAALVGFSLGGMINRRCAMDHPERVSALAILNSPHERGDAAQKIVEARARDTRSGGPAANIDDTLARWFTKDFRKTDAVVVRQVRDLVLANDHKNYAAHRRVLAEGVKELIRPAAPITHSTLVMTCANDTGSTPEMAYAIASEIPGAQSIVVPSLQHLGLIEKPFAFAKPLKAFLSHTLN